MAPKMPISRPREGSGPLWFLGPQAVHSFNGISIGSSVLVQTTLVTNRYTDKETTLYSGVKAAFMLHVAMLPNNKTTYTRLKK